MSDIQHLKIGDKIVDFGQVYKIFKIKKDKALDGTREEYLYYKPYFKSDKNFSLICSVPKSNFKKANLRKPVTKKKTNEILEILGKKPNDETKVTPKQVSDYLKKNDPTETARLLKLLWLEKQSEEKKFATRKKTIYQNTVRCLVEEISVVQKIGLKEARQKIRRCLKKNYPEKKEKEDDK